MALFVFLAAAAGARIVRTNLLVHTNGLRHLLTARVLTVGGRHGRLDGTAAAYRAHLRTLRAGHHLVLLRAVLAHVLTLRRLCLTHLVRVAGRNLGTHEDGDGAVVEAVQHLLEQAERLDLVDEQRVLLLVTGRLHAVAQFV